MAAHHPKIICHPANQLAPQSSSSAAMGWEAMGWVEMGWDPTQ